MALQTSKTTINNTDTTVSFSPNVNTVKIVHVSGDKIHINFNGAATTNHFPMVVGEEIQIGIKDASSLHAITDSSTAVITVVGTDVY